MESYIKAYCDRNVSTYSGEKVCYPQACCEVDIFFKGYQVEVGLKVVFIFESVLYKSTILQDSS